MALVLVVDDSAFQRKKTCRMLERGGFETTEASDGEKALEVVKAKQLDFILSDLNMPNMTGIELLRKLQEQENDIPIAIITSDVQETTREECMEHGAAEVLNKPFNEDKLRIMLENYLGPQEGEKL